MDENIKEVKDSINKPVVDKIGIGKIVLMVISSMICIYIAIHGLLVAAGALIVTVKLEEPTFIVLTAAGAMVVIYTGIFIWNCVNLRFIKKHLITIGLSILIAMAFPIALGPIGIAEVLIEIVEEYDIEVPQGDIDEVKRFIEEEENTWIR